MANVTDKQVDQARERVEKLRQEVQDTEAAIVAAEQSNSNVVFKATLDAEAERLKAQLDALKERRKLVNVSVEQTVEQVQGGSVPSTGDDGGAPTPPEN